MKETIKLISVEDAAAIIKNEAEDFGIEEVPFQHALGRILKEAILADREMPPFNRVSMDGIAINSSVFESGNRQFEIEGVQAAGSEQLSLHHSENCLEAMTGAMLPFGTDAVIPYELVTIEDNLAKVHIEDVSYFQNVHQQGLDRKKNDILIQKNTKLSSAEIGILATVGKTRVKVATFPKVAIISTGDELVDVNQTPKPFQIRKSNVHNLLALLETKGIHAHSYHLRDNKTELKQKIKKYLGAYDVLMFSGAVSKGKFDFLPEILNELGVKKLFHKVQQRPGKPFWFGKKNKTTVFAFPGNPVSTYVSCLKYFFPWLSYSQTDMADSRTQAILATDFHFKPNLTYFLQVKLQNERGCVMAYPEAGNGSGDLANLTLSDAFLELPPNKNEFKKGEVYPVIQYRF